MMYRRWTQGAVECYARGGVCVGCETFEIIGRKCRMKQSVLELIQHLGPPPDKFDIPFTHRELLLNDEKAPQPAPIGTKRKVKDKMDKNERKKTLAKWISDTYKKPYAEALITKPATNYADKTLYANWVQGKSYLLKGRKIKTAPRLMYYLDDYKAVENNDVVSAPVEEITKDCEIKAQRFGVLTGDIVRIFDNKNLAACFIDGYNAAGKSDARIVEVV